MALRVSLISSFSFTCAIVFDSFVCNYSLKVNGELGCINSSGAELGTLDFRVNPIEYNSNQHLALALVHTYILYST